MQCVRDTQNYNRFDEVKNKQMSMLGR